MRVVPAVPALIAALALAAGLTACGGDTDPTSDGVVEASGSAQVLLGGSTAAARPTVDRPWGTVPTMPEMEAAEPPGQGDVTFAQQMVVHHRQAIEISRNLLALDPTDERVAASARFVARDQRLEIAAMSDWLDAWDAAPAPSGPDAHAGMPGMVAQADVDALRERSVAAGEVDFLLLMLEHHQGAVTMAQDYLDVALNSYTLSVARHVIREQQIEIDWMRTVVDDLCGSAVATPAATCPG